MDKTKNPLNIGSNLGADLGVVTDEQLVKPKKKKKRTKLNSKGRKTVSGLTIDEQNKALKTGIVAIGKEHNAGAHSWSGSSALTEYGLNLRQSDFIHEYLDNGGNGKRAVLKVYDCKESTASARVSELLANPKVKKALTELIASRYNKDYVTERLAYFTRNAKTEENQIKTTIELGKMISRFEESDGGGGIGKGVQVNIDLTLPGSQGMNKKPEEVIDIEFKEV